MRFNQNDLGSFIRDCIPKVISENTGKFQNQLFEEILMTSVVRYEIEIQFSSLIVSGDMLLILFLVSFNFG